MAAVTIGARLDEPEEVVDPRRRIVFTLDDGSEISVRITQEGDSLEVRNLGTMEPQGIAVLPASGNTVWLEVR